MRIAFINGSRLAREAQRADLRRSGLLEQVIAIDPNYALAYAGLADCYGILRANGRSTADNARARARAAIERAMSLAPSDPEVLCSQGIFIFYFDAAWHPAEEYFRKARTLDDTQWLSP